MLKLQTKCLSVIRQRRKLARQLVKLSAVGFWLQSFG